MFIWLAVIIVTVFLDQLTKYLTILYLKTVDTIPLWENVLHLTYVENTGAAFGSLKDARWVFMIISTVAIIAILGYMIYRNEICKRPLPFVEALSLSFIVGGGIGNMIDRIFLKYVVDMIDFRLINFAVFNVADSFVCIGSGLMMLYLFAMMLKEGKEAPMELPEEITEEIAEGITSPMIQNLTGEITEETIIWEEYVPETIEAAEETQPVDAVEEKVVSENVGPVLPDSEDEAHE